MIDDRADDDFLASAQQALRSDGDRALASLGWWELLDDLDDLDARRAVFALFRAQGREQASTPALGGLLAQPFLAGTGHAPGTVVATVLRRSPRRGPIRVVVGDPADRRLLVDEPGAGAGLVDPADVDLVPVDVPGRLAVHEVLLDASARRPIVEEEAAPAARQHRDRLGRVALACEMLGAAETAVAMAVEHAGGREQFGRPIGTFQAVRHLLARAQTDCVALDASVRQAVVLDAAAPSRYDAIVKALAGRNGSRACQRALQVLGGIGFTAEHDHHHLASRVMLLDALLGTRAELSHDLGRQLRETGEDPRIAQALLLAPRSPLSAPAAPGR